MTSECVSVVVPSYNAGKTLDETLRSVRSQTHAALDIIVVDDGSTDDTAALAQRHADADPRVRVIRQQNAGVAAARNTGWQAAQGNLIALIDSDDLWAPEKIERQLQALALAGPQAGFVYCFFTRIDAASMMAGKYYPEACSGEVLDQILAHNFVGNGSTFMARREIFVQVGGFDNSLRAAGAQGCDDYLFCCRAAEICHFAVVPEILVGYREMPGSISSSARKMLRSWMLSAEQIMARLPAKRAIILGGLRFYAEWLTSNAFYGRRWRQLLQILSVLARYHPKIALQITASFLPRLCIDIARSKKHRWMLKRQGRSAPPPVRHERFPIGEIGLLEASD